MTATKTQQKRNVLVAAAPNYAHNEVLNGARQFVNPNTGKASIELQFANGANVIMPSNWTLKFDLYEGGRYDAYWEGGKFHLVDRNQH